MDFFHEAPNIPLDAGGKIVNLQRLIQTQHPVPPTLFLPPQAYFHFIKHNSLQQHITSFANIDINSVRWEEIWGAALTLRNMFLRHPIPNEIALPLLNAIHTHFGSTSIAIRSCALHEDSTFSHAGMHDSILDVSGNEEILKAVQQIWSSLWPDRAILYRKEMELDANTSGMGIIIQPMIYGQPQKYFSPKIQPMTQDLLLKLSLWTPLKR